MYILFKVAPFHKNIARAIQKAPKFVQFSCKSLESQSFIIRWPDWMLALEAVSKIFTVYFYPFLANRTILSHNAINIATILQLLFLSISAFYRSDDVQPIVVKQ